MTEGGKSEKTGATGFPGDDNYDPGVVAEVDDKDIAALLAKGLAKGWLPQPGDQLGGMCIDRYMGTSDFGEYPIVEVEQSDGSVIALHGFHRVLRGQIERKDPQPGDRVGCVYYGLAEFSKKGQDPARMYKLVVIHGPNYVAQRTAVKTARPDAVAILKSALGLDEEPF